MKIGIIAPVREEAASLLEDGFYHWNRAESGLFRSDRGITLILSGVGKVLAGRAACRILPESDELLVIGTAGGLGNESIGSLFLVNEFVEHDMDVSALGIPKGVTPFSEIKDYVIPSLPGKLAGLVEKICAALGVELARGRIMSGDQFITDRKTAVEKKSYFGADLVDMESAAAAKIAFLEKKPLTALRYISDNADHQALDSWSEHVRESSKIMNRILKGILN